MLSAEQQQIRRTGIGSSDISALVGENPYANAHDVWLDKLGLREVEESEPMWWGTALEQSIGQRYKKELGVELESGSGAIRHPSKEIALASPDFVYPDKSRIVECKAIFRTAGQWSPESDGAPEQYILQGNWQCGVMGVERFDIAAFIAGFCQFRIYQFAFDQELFDHCVSVAERFWNEHVLKREPPPVDHSDSARLAIMARFPQRAPLKDAPPEAEQLIQERVACEERFDRADEALKLVNNKLRLMIGEAEGMRGDWGHATHKTDKRGVRSLRVTLKTATKGKAA